METYFILIVRKIFKTRNEWFLR